MLNILNLKGAKTLKREELQLINGGIEAESYKLVCQDGAAVNTNIDDCHCVGMSDGIYLIKFSGGGYTTYDVLGKKVDSGVA